MIAWLLLLLATFAIFGKIAAAIVFAILVFVVIAMIFFGFVAFSFITDFMNMRN